MSQIEETQECGAATPLIIQRLSWREKNAGELGDLRLLMENFLEIVTCVLRVCEESCDLGRGEFGEGLGIWRS